MRMIWRLVEIEGVVYERWKRFYFHSSVEHLYNCVDTATESFSTGFKMQGNNVIEPGNFRGDWFPQVKALGRWTVQSVRLFYLSYHKAFHALLPRRAFCFFCTWRSTIPKSASDAVHNWMPSHLPQPYRSSMALAEENGALGARHNRRAPAECPLLTLIRESDVVC